MCKYLTMLQILITKRCRVVTWPVFHVKVDQMLYLPPWKIRLQ